MKEKILYLSIFLAITGCQSTSHILQVPIFDKVIEYKSDKQVDQQIDKDYMYYVMLGQLELNEGNTKRAIQNYEKSLALKKNDVAYTLLSIYYKENDYNNARRMADLIKSNNIYNTSVAENILVNLLNNDYKEAATSINAVSVGISTKNKDLPDLEYQTKAFKDLADLLFFAKVNMNDFSSLIPKDDFTIINFFYLYNQSNSQGAEPDEALKYLMNTLNKESLLHNFVLFRIAYVENYHFNVYKDELTYLTNHIDNYNLDVNALEKFYTNDNVEYEKLKEKLIKKYPDNVNFWYILSLLDAKTQPDESLVYMKKAYSLIKENEPTNDLKEKILSQIISAMIISKHYDVESYINDFEDYNDKRKNFSYLIFAMIKNNEFNESILTKYKGIVKKVDQYLQISKAYSYLERYNDAMTYLTKAEEIASSNVEVNLEKIHILAELNPVIAQNEAEIYSESNDSPETQMTILYVNLINKKDIKEGLKAAKNAYLKFDKRNIKIKDYETTPIYLYARYSYENGKYAKAKELMEKLDIQYNYIYMADYGRILWSLNQKTKAKVYFKKSKEIFDSKYLSNIIKELNIKNME